MNKALDLLREIRPSIPKEVLELWCKDRDAFLASHPAVEQAGGDERAAFEAAASKLGIYTCNFERYTEETAAHENRINARVEDPVRAGDYRSATLQDCWKVWQEARAALAQPSPALPPFAEKVLDKLRRFYDCASDFESGGVDIGRHWLDLLTQLGLLNRVQRSPALWEISQQGEDLLGAPQHFPARTEQANSGYDQLWAWFGLSRSAYAVLPRVMMHAMPDDWQRRFAELMNEWDDHWPNQPDINARVHITQNGLYISTPKWLLDYRHPDHNQLNAMRGKDEL
ncbi:hypothetical protein ISD48_26210 [Pseudomonas aeruginosa]|nr:hypothetical protein [Pseudomonas aeruginosa]